jgi:hypothetical protein
MGEARRGASGRRVDYFGPVETIVLPRFAACCAGAVDADGDGDGLGLGGDDGVDVPVSVQLYVVAPDAVCVQAYVCVVPDESVQDHVHDDGGGPAGPWDPGVPDGP